jgi:hypothetical protein
MHAFGAVEKATTFVSTKSLDAPTQQTPTDQRMPFTANMQAAGIAMQTCWPPRVGGDDRQRIDRSFPW